MPSVCLVMIVKNEAHIIKDTLRHLLKYVPIDTWSICDTGSTDSTKEHILQFFSEREIPGQIHETEWKDFGHNRTIAFDMAAATSQADYMFVWDADDSIEGNFVFPTNLEADWYKFKFGHKGGFRYSRCQLFSSRKGWKYVGVLHEYPACKEACGSPTEVTGDYYFVSGRSGARNKNPLKYQDDARILEAGYKKAIEEKDPIHCRYAFYCAQSYASANIFEKAVEFYRVVLTLESWAQEKYMSCLSLYNHLTTLGKEQEGLAYLVESFKYDRTRVECIYRLVKYYCIKGLPEVAMTYYGLIQTYFESEYIGETGGRERLFANMDEYDFYLPYYMIIVADRLKRHEIAAKMYEIIFTKRFTGTTKWWIDNLFTNAQFCYHAFPKTVDFLGKMFDYVNDLRARKIYLEPKHNAILTKIVEGYTPVLCAANSFNPLKPVAPRVMLTMTTCKRLALFRKTVNSILNTWTDLNHIDAFFCVDDNSSEEDREVMRSEFPFFEYHMKGQAERGHRQSMNIIWEKLTQVKPTYWIHLEDDWMFFHRGSFVERGIQALDKYANQHIHQVVFNRNYGVVYNDLERTGGFEQDDRIILHELNPNLPGRHSGYWPHYSLQPSICRTATILALGDYTTSHRFFERGYAEKYNAAGHKTAFFDSVYSTHIGKQHWETEGQNAYALNEVSQFQMVLKPNEPLVGSMAEHLDQVIGKIRSKTPFGLIRPSDGEYAILMNRTLKNCDDWTWRAGGVLREQLAESVRTINPNLYIGIPCNSCNKSWNCTNEIYTNFLEKFHVPPPQITYANIFMNSNWAKWTEFIRNYPGGFYLVGSGGSAETTTLQIKGKHAISATLVNSWDTDGESETSRLLEFISELRGDLICFAAGPLSKVWIPLCMKRNPANMYVDVGASLDVFTKGATNRMYTNPSHPFAKETCVFRQKPAKRLVYFCVFFKEDYIQLLKLLLTSLIYFSKTDGIDFLVFTSEDFKSKIEILGHQIGLSIQFHFMECNSTHEASSSKLRIFDYPSIDSYETILYLDTDIIIQGDITQILNNRLDDLVYAIPEGRIGHEFWGGTLFNLDTVDPNTEGMNAGVILFKNSETTCKIFKAALDHIETTKRDGKVVPLCLEQPFLNFHAYSKCNKTLLQKYVALYKDKPPAPHSLPTDISICHFAWPLGDTYHKMRRMASHLSHLCSSYSKLYDTNTKILPAYNKYTWGNGFVEITESGLNTSWGPGKYTILNAQMLYLSWNGLTHLVRFNPSMKRYVSVRLNDAIISSGERIYVPTKNLLYFCVFHNHDYCRLARLLLTSMRLYSSIKAFDILVMTTEEFRKEFEALAKELRIHIQVYTLPLKTVFQAACARLKIFDWDEIDAYKTILYVDTDIIIKGDLESLFQIPSEDKLYAIQSGTIASRNFGGDLFKDWVDFSKTGFNSGTLLFRNSTPMRKLFANTWTQAMEHALSPPACMDQPFLNYQAIKDDLVDNIALNPFVSLYEDNDVVINEATSVLSHFSFPIGNFAHKFQRMSAYFLKGLARKEETAFTFVGKTYSWGASGSITFGVNGLETTWGTGTYEVLGEKRIKASWNGFEHYLTFFKEEAEYVSVRTNPEDYDIVFGRLQNGESIYIYGDSHAKLLFNGLTVPHKNLFEYGTTMHKIGRDNVIPKHHSAHNSKDATFVFVYGEVDCRAHIRRQVETGRQEEEVCQTLVKAYFKTIKSSITLYRSIIVVGIPPPTDEVEHRHEHSLPFTGTKEERVEYTRRMNTLLEAACADYGFIFFAPFQNYTRADGCLDYTLSDGCIHIGKNAKFLQAFRDVLLKKPEYPVILHTCDKYEQFWNHWYFFFRKYVSGVSKVYFVTEEKEPVFSDEVTVIKTGGGPWGKRLLIAFEQISEPYVYYMQEDFWATQAFNPSTYVPTFFHYGMDALRITDRSPLYSLDQVSGTLYRFKQNSDYLMTHQFSLWKRDYFRKWIRAEDEPWGNEMEQSVEIAKTKHTIYLIDASWYEATVRRGTLQPNGKQLLDAHSEEIAKSFVNNDWYAKFLLKIRESLATQPIESFPNWQILHFTMFTPANSAECAAIGYKGGAPQDVLERNKLHHKFLWTKFTEIVGQTAINGIFEFGGGYGQLRKVVYEMRAEIPYAIYDFPELHAIQRHFLATIPTEFYTSTDDLPTGKYNIFVSFWGYTESPKELRDGLIPFFKAAAFDVLFFGLAQTFQLDNIAYLKRLADILGYSVEFVPINEMKSHDGIQFFGILRK
uniref:Glycosyltransferase 2-like domain-containing protein n=1 Tax=viral metagenome TaxID=1070528 RepID=A0A6C0K9N4_9ZZZZ